MAKKPLSVETLTHEDATRKNAPTAELETFLDPAMKRPIQVAYKRRNPDLDPLAQSAEAQPLLSPAPVLKKEASNKPICRRELKTSSQMGAAKICLTRQQWEEKDEAGRRDLRQTQGNGGR